MNVRDPNFTARLEPALTILANQPARMLSYLEDRFDLESGELQSWLDEFNGGQKALKFTRIHEVKRELAGHQVLAQKTKPEPTAPATDILLSGDRAPRESDQAEPAAVPPAPPTEKPRPAQPPTHAASPAPAAAAPWLQRKFFAETFTRWRPIIAQIVATGDLRAALKTLAEGKEREACRIYCKKTFGGSDVGSDAARDFLAWADERCGTPAPDTKSNGREVVQNDEWHCWRRDAIAALRTMGLAARRAELQVDAAIKALNGEDCDVGELVKLALKQNASGVASSTAIDKPAQKAASREPRAASREPRAASREPRAASREPRAASREPRARTRIDRILASLRHINRRLDQLLASFRAGRSAKSKSSSGSCRRATAR